MMKVLSRRAGSLALGFGLATALAMAACGGGSGGDTSSGTGGGAGSGTGGGTGTGGSTGSGTGTGGGGSTTSTSSSTSSGGSQCMEITVGDLKKVTASGDYNYGSKTSAIGGSADDNYVLELYNGLDEPDITIETDAKNDNPSTCEACGWVFEDGADKSAAKIYFHTSGHISLVVPNFGNELSAEPMSGTITDIVFREVKLTDPNDLYSAKIVAGGACLHLASASF